jgi:biofilm PGA synthesis N-glycosyltransferase PgaC
MLGMIALASAIAIISVWLIYPLCMAALAVVTRRVPRPTPAQPTVSVVLATREDAEVIRARVEDLLGTSYDPSKLEIVVAIDPRKVAFTQEDLGVVDDRVRVVVGDDPGGKAATLNAGVRAAKGEILSFADSHQRFGTEAIPRLVSALSDPRFGAASGCLDLRSDNGRRSLVEQYWRFERWLRRSEGHVHSTVGVTGAIYALRRSLWNPLPAGLILDDVYVPMQVVLQGHRVAFVEDACAVETRQPTPAQEYQRKVRTLTGNFQLCAWLPSILVPFRNPIWAQFLFHKLLRLLTPYWLLAIGIWLVVVSIRSIGNHVPESIAAVAGVVVLLLITKPGVTRPLRTIFYQGVLMQAAVVMATVNGVRGRWNVWDR